MKRATVMALSVILALIVAAPMATAQKASESQDLLEELTAAWWTWAAQDPSPLVGDYEGGELCKTVSVDGKEYIFLAGTTGGEAERTCTVPADTPILLPVVNALCSEGFRPPDPAPYPQCAERLIDQALEDSETFATLDGTNLEIQRIASGTFDWTVESNKNPFGVKKGTYDAGAYGLWVYLPQGLEPGDYTLTFGGSFFGGDFTVDVTYHLIVE